MVADGSPSVSVPPGPQHQAGQRAAWVVVAAVTAAIGLLLVLAVYRITAKGFWYDEAMSLTFARWPIDRFVDTLAGFEANGSLYYTVLRGWRLLGEGEARVRFLSVLCMAATIPLLYVVGRRHVGRTAAVIACFLFAASPFVIEYAQEARSYAMAVLLVTAALVAWSFATATDRTRWWVAYAVLASASLYAHFFAGFVVIGLGVAWLLGFARRTRSGIMAQAAVVAAGLPLLVFIGLSGLGQVWWIKPLSDASLSAVLGKPGGGSIALSVLLYGGAIVGLVTRDRARALRLAPIAIWWLAPVMAGLLISVGRSFTEPRYFIVALPGLLLLTAAGFARAGAAVGRAAGRPRWGPGLAVVPLVVAVGLAAAPIDAWYTTPRGDWRAAAAWVARTAEPGDRIIYNVDRGRYPMGIYLERYADGWPVDATIDEVRASTGRTWVVYHLLSDYGQRLFRETLPGYRVVESKVFQGLRVQLLERTGSG